ncbi:hypothetical protein CA850_03980 [Micromonospora echinospora]|uniref:Uncharacterized protein n=1 Tax=Micromonospora echinospora TaxID=1877 RepID=A0A1C4ZZZ0_MICEC|nr:hypothetical protein [Micromonospora echinospora]OZV83817.1 hypothetical protein CA850_03980 [Micromonospora echinospora]SCF38505.1 hypothetical protein GA0070618_6048 [Micromonospora echinospora]
MSTADALPHLTPNQINALVVLMVEARELTNTELRELAGFPLTGADNTKLVKLGLVSTDRSQRPFSHELTEHGWHVARRLHTARPPRQSGSATRSLLTVLANVDRGLNRLRTSQADFFRQDAPDVGADDPARGDDSTTTPPAGTTTSTDTVPAPHAADPAATAGPESAADDAQTLVRTAYRELAVTPGAWVGLADLRELLDEYDRETVDAALRALVRQDDVRIIPVANSKSLTARDRAAAVLIGNEANHALSIGPA